MSSQKNHGCPKMGPDPILLNRKEVDALYETLDAVRIALEALGVEYIVTGGSLLGSIRQHSILFCDDDIDIAIIEKHRGKNEIKGDTAYDIVSQNLGRLLGDKFIYQIRPWEGGDKVRPKRYNTVFIDIFTLRRFDSFDELVDLIGIKKNGQPQNSEYIENIVKDIKECVFSQNERQLYGVKDRNKNQDQYDNTASICPFWHFNTRKAIEMWRKEVYRHDELFPLCTNLKFGPLQNIKGPRMPVLLLRRAFGYDCFHVYYQSATHTKGMSKIDSLINKNNNQIIDSLEKGSKDETQKELKPLILNGGNWENSKKLPLEDIHYLPMQPIARAKRRPTMHNREQLFKYLEFQEKEEKRWMAESSFDTNECKKNQSQFVVGSTNLDLNHRPQCTVYMDGVFDLFHVGHVEAIYQCAKLGNRVIIGITGDLDAAQYKRPPIISQYNRIAVVQAMKYVDQIICPCPLIVTEEFMIEHRIDLVVHGFANDDDAKKQEIFFEIPMKLNKFRRIGYYEGLSTTDIINKINTL